MVNNRNEPAVTRWTAYSKSVVSTAGLLLRAAWRAASLQMLAMSAPSINKYASHINWLNGEDGISVHDAFCVTT